MSPSPVCAHYCAADAECSGAGALCLTQLSDGMGGALPGITLCTRACDPMTSSGCALGTACDVFRETAGAMRWLTDCRAPIGTLRQGATCNDTTLLCDRNFTCLDPDGMTGPASQQCLRWCNAGTGTGCSGLETCFGFMTPILIGGTQYGVCYAS
jgi:hypothetical protein